MNNGTKHTPCERVLEQIDAYLEGDLSPDDMKAVEHHIAGCISCNEELEAARRIMHELHALPEKECPESVVAGVLETIRETSGAQEPIRQSPGFLHRFLWKWRIAAVAVVLVLIAIPAIFIHKPQPLEQSYSDVEIARAERQVKATFAYIEHVGQQTATTINNDVIETRVIYPLRRVFQETLETELLPKNNSHTQRSGFVPIG